MPSSASAIATCPMMEQKDASIAELEALLESHMTGGEDLRAALKKLQEQLAAAEETIQENDKLFEEEHSRHRIEVAELAGIQAQMEKDLAARDGRIPELEARIAELEAQVEEVIEEKDAVERKVVVMAQVMEEEQLRHRIEVAELEGIQEQMLKELSENDAKVALLEEETVALTAAVAVEQNAGAQVEQE